MNCGRIIVLVVLYVLVSLVVASESVCYSQLRQYVDQVLREKQGRSNYAIQCRHISGEILYSHNSEQLLTPASNNKVLTTIPAILMLGEDFRFQTRLLVRNHTLRVATRGDPSLTTKQLVSAIQRSDLQSMSIDRVELDVSAFNGVTDPFPDTWEWGDLKEDYGAQPTCAVLDHNYVMFVISPGNRVNDPLRVQQISSDGSTSPLVQIPIVGLENTRTVDAQQQEQPGDLYYTFADGTALRIRGTMRINSPPITLYRSVINPETFVAQSIAKMVGNVKNVSVTSSPLQNPDEWMVASVIESSTLKELMNFTLQVSDNLYAELFSRQMGVLAFEQKILNEPNVQLGGIAYVKQALSQLGVNTEGSVLQGDGSGVSRRNLVTANAMVDALHFLRIKHPETYKTYFNLLPVGGVSGTLKSRFTQYPGIVHAKTGSLTGVASLSGYVKNKYMDDPLTFSIIVNESLLPGSEIRKTIDEIVLLFAFVDPNC